MPRKAMSDTPIAGYSDDNVAYVTRNWMLRSMEGRILTVIETLGLKEVQEEAAKSLMRQAVWSILKDGNYYITNEAADEALDKSRKMMGDKQV